MNHINLICSAFVRCCLLFCLTLSQSLRRFRWLLFLKFLFSIFRLLLWQSDRDNMPRVAAYTRRIAYNKHLISMLLRLVIFIREKVWGYRYFRIIHVHIALWLVNPSHCLLNDSISRLFLSEDIVLIMINIRCCRLSFLILLSVWWRFCCFTLLFRFYMCIVIVLWLLVRVDRGGLMYVVVGDLCDCILVGLLGVLKCIVVYL